MDLRISEHREITIPQEFLDRSGLRPNDEVDITPTERGLLISKSPVKRDAIESVYGCWGSGGNTDDYMNEVRGR